MPKGRFIVKVDDELFNLRYTLGSGRAFRWTEKGEWWYGVLPHGVLKLRRVGPSLFCSASSDRMDTQTVHRYPGLNEDLEQMLASIVKDSEVSEAVQALYAPLIPKQDVWVCLLSFVIAANSNIPRITSKVSKICQAFGQAEDLRRAVPALSESRKHLRGHDHPGDMGAGCGPGQNRPVGEGARERGIISRPSLYSELTVFVATMVEFAINTEGRPFSLPYTLDSGQAFRWRYNGNNWYGVMGGGVLRVRQEGATLVCSSSIDNLDTQAVYHYFGLEEDLERILASVMKDSYITAAVQTYYGLRIMKQDIWECLLSFAVATNSNIPRIKAMIANLCDRFGEKVRFEDEDFSLFPTSRALAEATVPQLAACGLGYRARYVKSISEMVDSGWMSLEELRLHDYERAKELLTEEILGKKTLMGIGPKVADCVLLFSCDKNSAFPIDVWMAKVLSREYPRLFEKELRERLTSKVSGRGTLSEGTYERVAAAARGYFGGYAGYAQQYLFHHERTREG